MTNPATSTYAQPTAHSPASSVSHSSSSGGSRDSRSPSHSPAHSPETRSHQSLPLVPVPTYASNQYFPHHLAYPPPSSMPQAQMQSHSFPYSFAGPPVSSPVKVEGSGSSTALDMLAVAAGTSAHPPPTASMVSLTIAELHRRHLEQQDKISAGLKRQAEEIEEAKKKKKRIGRGLDPGKTSEYGRASSVDTSTTDAPYGYIQEHSSSLLLCLRGTRCPSRRTSTPRDPSRPRMSVIASIAPVVRPS